MALARRRRSEAGANYWPGFVDAMATLLLVIIFLLSIFSLVQFLLAREISGRDTALNELRSQIAELTDLLALESASGRSLEVSIAGLTDDLAEAEVDRVRLAGLLGQAEGANSALRNEVIILRDLAAAEEAGRRGALAELEQRQEVIVDLRSEAEKREALLASLRGELGTEQVARAEAEATVAGQEATIVDLRSEAEKNQAAFAAVAGQLRTAETAAAEVSADLERQRLLVVDLRTEAAAARAEAVDATGTLASERQAREQLVAALNQRAASLEEDLAQAEEARRRLVVLSTQSAENLAARREAIDRLASEQRRLIVLQDQNARQMAALREDIAVLTGRAEDAETEAERAEGETEETRRVIIDLRSERDRASAEAGRLSGRLGTATSERDRALENIEVLNAQLAALRRQIGALQIALEASEERDLEKNVRIADLGRRLNVALAQKVKELAAYRSEFFGRLREILSDRSDIKIVGDRFVFQSEVLFPSASDQINPAGRGELAKLAEAVIQLEGQIPDEITWVLRVDGHTDRRPISNPVFANNWELSSARAISVVQFLIAQGVEPRRLVAAGFGEFQPIQSGEDEAAFSANRRIELKLTER
jgi:chemotaxis protein MotB